MYTTFSQLCLEVCLSGMFVCLFCSGLFFKKTSVLKRQLASPTGEKLAQDMEGREDIKSSNLG